MTEPISNDPGNHPDPKESEALRDALYNVIRNRADPDFHFPTVFDALTDIFALLVTGSTEGKPDRNIDLATTAISREIADRAHRLRRLTVRH